VLLGLFALTCAAQGLSFAVSAQAGEVLPSGLHQRGPNWGLGLGADYEWPGFRSGTTLFFGGGGDWGTFALRADAAWLPLDGPWTPYLGGGIGFIGIGQKRPTRNEGEGIGPGYMELLPLLSLQAGAELLRDRGVHLMAGAQLDLPWSHPFDCNDPACTTGGGYVWKVRYPILSLVGRLLF